MNQVALAANEPPNEADSSQNWKSDVEEAVDERMVVHTTATDASQHLLLVSMLEHLCSVYVIDPVESRKVFKGSSGHHVEMSASAEQRNRILSLFLRCVFGGELLLCCS